MARMVLRQPHGRCDAPAAKRAMFGDARRHEGMRQLQQNGAARDAYGTIVICDAATSNGLNSPVRPCGSFAVTV